jgi:hypothetical protein
MSGNPPFSLIRRADRPGHHSGVGQPLAALLLDRQASVADQGHPSAAEAAGSASEVAASEVSGSAEVADLVEVAAVGLAAEAGGTKRQQRCYETANLELSYRSRRAIRLDVSHRLPPIFCTSE